MKRLSGVIFDLDGTLIDSLTAYTLAFNRTVDRHRLLPINLHEMSDLLNQFISLDDMLHRTYPHLGAEKRAAFMTEMRNEFIALAPDHITLQPYAKEVLGELREQGMKIGIATGRMSDGSSKWRELRNLRIDSLIDAVVTAGETRPKPDPASLIKCVFDLGLTPDACVFVGDSRADIIAARSAGVISIAIPTGVASRQDLAEEQPQYIIDSLAMLPGQLSALCDD
jgi:HAD superfamily hydrolase (TIGR01549 family)